MSGSGWGYAGGYGASIAAPYPFVYKLDGGTPTTAVTLAVAKEFLREDLSVQNNVIQAALDAATLQLESEFGLVAVRRTFTYRSNGYPWRQQQCNWNTIQLPMAPFASGCTVTSLKYRDSDGTQITIDSGDYTVQAVNGQYGACGITINQDAQWPDINLDYPDAFEAVYSIGFTDTVASVPAPIRIAVLNKMLETYSRDMNATEASHKNRMIRGGVNLVSIYGNVNNYLRVA